MHHSTLVGAASLADITAQVSHTPHFCINSSVYSESCDSCTGAKFTKLQRQFYNNIRVVVNEPREGPVVANVLLMCMLFGRSFDQQIRVIACRTILRVAVMMRDERACDHVDRLWIACKYRL